MTYQQRQRLIAEEAAAKLGSQAALARYMETTRQQVNDWISGKCQLRGAQLLKLQDLLRKSACVALATLAGHFGTSETAIAAGKPAPSGAETTAYALHILGLWLRARLQQLIQHSVQLGQRLTVSTA